MSNAEHFEKHGCTLVKGFIDKQTAAVISQYFENKIKRGEWVERQEAGISASRLFYYADPLIEVLLQASKEAVESATGKELLPTYSYARVYQPGEALKPHVDRPSCEVSVTVNVATTGEISPIYTQYQHNDPEKHLLDPGDAVIYLGCDVTHWRQPLKDGQINVQYMLHYVDKNGPNAAYAKDKRPDYGLSENTRSK